MFFIFTPVKPTEDEYVAFTGLRRLLPLINQDLLKQTKFCLLHVSGYSSSGMVRRNPTFLDGNQLIITLPFGISRIFVDWYYKNYDLQNIDRSSPVAEIPCLGNSSSENWQQKV